MAKAQAPEPRTGPTDLAVKYLMEKPIRGWTIFLEASSFLEDPVVQLLSDSSIRAVIWQEAAAGNSWPGGRAWLGLKPPA